MIKNNLDQPLLGPMSSVRRLSCRKTYNSQPLDPCYKTASNVSMYSRWTYTSWEEIWWHDKLIVAHNAYDYNKLREYSIVTTSLIFLVHLSIFKKKLVISVSLWLVFCATNTAHLSISCDRFQATIVIRSIHQKQKKRMVKKSVYTAKYYVR